MYWKSVHPIVRPYGMECTGRVHFHDDIIKWKHFPRNWPFVRGIHRSPVNSLHEGQWRWALMFSLICTRINGWVNNREAGDLRRHRAHYDAIVMLCDIMVTLIIISRFGRPCYEGMPLYLRKFSLETFSHRAPQISPSVNSVHVHMEVQALHLLYNTTSK